MVDAGNTELQPAQEVILGRGRAVLVDHGLAIQSHHLDGRGQGVLDIGAFAFETVNEALCPGLFSLPLNLIVKHQFNEFALRQQRGKVGQGQHKVTFVHNAKAFKVSGGVLHRWQRTRGRESVKTLVQYNSAQAALPHRHVTSSHCPSLTRLG